MLEPMEFFTEVAMLARPQRKVSGYLPYPQVTTEWGLIKTYTPQPGKRYEDHRNNRQLHHRRRLVRSYNHPRDTLRQLSSCHAGRLSSYRHSNTKPHWYSISRSLLDQ